MAERTMEEIHSTCDLACEILQKTNDGNDLDPLDLKLLEHAVNGFLNTEGIAYLKELHEKVTSDKYKKPFFHGIEHLTIDPVGYVLWKGHIVEHYELSYAYTKDAKDSAIELARRCKILESKGIDPTVYSAIWRWEDGDNNSQSGKIEGIVA